MAARLEAQWLAHRTKAKHPVKNADLWQALDLAASRHQLTWRWVKGHAGHHVNERCDILANQAMDRIIREHTCEQLRQELQQFVAASAERPDTPPPLL